MDIGPKDGAAMWQSQAILQKDAGQSRERRLVRTEEATVICCWGKTRGEHTWMAIWMPFCVTEALRCVVDFVQPDSLTA